MLALPCRSLEVLQVALAALGGVAVGWWFGVQGYWQRIAFKLRKAGARYARNNSRRRV